MWNKTLVPIFLCTRFAGTVVVGVGGAAASKTSKTVLAVGPHIPKNGGRVNLTAYSNNDGPKSVVVLSGVIGDYGEAVRTSTGSSSNDEDDELDVVLTRGSFRLDITRVEGKLRGAIFGAFPTNSSTCSGQVMVAGTAPIVLGSGTGAYKGLNGTFKMNITINEVEKWPSCPKTDTSPFLAQTVFLSGSGSVSLR
jgi:hypothetical protein